MVFDKFKSCGSYVLTEDQASFTTRFCKTSTSPVINGAWGSAEQEILSNPLSNYKIVGATETQNPYGECKGVILQLEEIVPDEKE